MTDRSIPERWLRIESVLSAALERAASERDAFLEEECAGDPALRGEVDSLLKAYERSGAFDALAASVAPLADRLLEPPAPPLAGRTVGRYQVLELVAGGGMGVVHRAKDERLGRTVALKFLRSRFGEDARAAERFRREARVVAALEHPNICTVHEIGETEDGQLYLAMPLYDGETLQQRVARGPLDVADAVGIAVQIARGLAKAHARGIVHRDVKPSNVFVTEDGVVKLLDFGIAKLAESGQNITTAETLGTAAYMSPEQLRNEPVDARTDVWSLGVVLYELLSGERPFRGATLAAIAAEIQRGTPPSLRLRRPAVPAPLERVVMRALATSPEARHPSAQAMERELLAVSTAATALAAAPPLRVGGDHGRVQQLLVGAVLAVAMIGVAVALKSGDERRAAGGPIARTREQSLAVLPFTGAAIPGEEERLGDRLAEDIIAELARVPQLRVISRISAMRFGGSALPLPEIARQLNVEEVLQGSVRRVDGRLRIAARLVRADGERERWAGNFDVAPSELPGIRRQIAREVARVLEVGAPHERLAPVARGTNDPAAYELYRRGRFHWLRRTREGHAQAVEYFRRAIARDSTYADAYAGLADTYLTGRRIGFSSRSEAEAQAGHDSAAARAFALDSNSSDARTSHALTFWWRHDWPGAERELERALQLNPANTIASGWYQILLGGLGRVQDAAREGRRAYAQDPFALIVSLNYAWSCYLAREYACAVEQYRHTLEIDSTFAQAPGQLGILYALTGRDAEALRMATRAVTLTPGNASYLADLAYVHATAGHRAEAYRLLKQAKTMTITNGFHLGMAYAALGEADSAFVYLERSSWVWPYTAARADPALDPLRSDPRFARLSAQVDRAMGLR